LNLESGIAFVGPRYTRFLALYHRHFGVPCMGQFVMPLSPFACFLVSGFTFSKVAALEKIKSVFRAFIFYKLMA
jgi:hypothetical protein